MKRWNIIRLPFVFFGRAWDHDGNVGAQNALPLSTGVHWTARANPIVAASATRTSESAHQKLLCALDMVMPGTFMVIGTS